MEKATVGAPNLQRLQAGEAATCRVKLFDAFGNTIAQSADVRFGLALVPADEKARRNKRPNESLEGKWVDGSSGGEFEMRYLPTKAGKGKLLVWYETQVEGAHRTKWKRRQLPGTPLDLSCAPGKWSPAHSSFDVEWTDANGENAKAVEKELDDIDDIAAMPTGSLVMVRPRIHDRWANMATLESGALTLEMAQPDGTSGPLELNKAGRSGGGGCQQQRPTRVSVPGQNGRQARAACRREWRAHERITHLPRGL